jgi:hypothetical protein
MHATEIGVMPELGSVPQKMHAMVIRRERPSVS